LAFVGDALPRPPSRDLVEKYGLLPRTLLNSGHFYPSVEALAPSAAIEEGEP